MRVFVGGRRVLVSLLAMFVSCVGVLFRLFVFAQIMMMGSLVMMMRRCVVLSGSLVVVLTGRMLRGRGLCHGAIPPNQPSQKYALVVAGIWGDLLLSARPRA
jgi:hypothetical protein